MKKLVLVLLSLVALSCSAGETETTTLDIPEFNIEEIFTSAMTLKVWKKPSADVHYELRYSVEEAMSDVVYDEFKSSSFGSEFQLEGLEPGTRYFIQLRVKDQEDNSAWSKTVVGETAEFSASFGTYNIFSIVHQDRFPEYDWEERKGTARDIMMQANNRPDVFGLQEMMVSSQMKDFEELMIDEGYDSYISTKELSPRAIFWNKELFSLVNSEDVEILPTSSPGYESQRYATYVRPQHISTGREIDVFNIHLPAGRDRQQVRFNASNQLSDYILDLYSKDKNPVIVLGDYNNYFDTVIEGMVSSAKVFSDKGFIDTFSASNKVNADYLTNIDKTTGEVKRNSVGGTRRIDYIFAYPEDRLRVSDYGIIINFEPGSDTKLAEPIPSDHNPVFSVLHFL